MVFTDLFSNWFALLGGVSGLALLAYMTLMVYFNRKKDKQVQELRVEVAEIRGILLGMTRRQR